MASSYDWENPTKQELWGGNGGTKWNFQPNGPITVITVNYGNFIDSVSFITDDGKGNVLSSGTYGGPGGGKEEPFQIKWPEDYLVSISGTYDTIESKYYIQSLCFKTKKSESKIYGKTGGQSFEFSMENGIIVGFHGRSSKYLDGIGVYVKPYADVIRPPKSLLQKGRDVQPAHILLSIKSFSLLPTERELKHESKFFDFDGYPYKWKLILFPNGEDNDGHISLFLAIDESTLVHYNNSPVYVDLKFFVLNKFTNTYLTIRDPKGAIVSFDKSRTRHGFAQLLSLDTFRNPCNGYLVDDACAFGAEFFVVQPPSLTKKEILTMSKNPIADPHDKNNVISDSARKSHTWEIKQFSEKVNGDMVRFTAQERTWDLHMRRYGKNSPKGESVSFYIQVHDPARKVYVKAKLQAVKQALTSEAKKISGWFDQSNTEWGIPDFLWLSDIHDYLDSNDTLRIKVNFEIISETKIE